MNYVVFIKGIFFNIGQTPIQIILFYAVLLYSSHP